MSNLAAIVDELALPATCDRETTWQNALRLVLPRALPVKLHRQIPGTHKQERGGILHGAPVGAADLSGWVVGAGLRIEVEAKHGKGKLHPAQRQWLAVCAADGVVAMVLTYDVDHSTLVNLHVAVEAMGAALRARGVVA